MAKSNNKISGRLGNVIFKQGAYGEYVTAPNKKAPSVAQLAALEPQRLRMAAINKLASQINRCVGYYDKVLTQARLFQRIKKLLFNQDADARVLMLEALRGMEVSKKYMLEAFNRPPLLAVNDSQENVVVEVDIQQHPADSGNYNCYYLHIVLLCWCDDEKEYVHEGKKTNWIFPSAGLPVYEMRFAKPAAAREYAVFVRQVCGKNEQEEGLLPERGMRLVENGSFEAGARQMLEDHRRAKKEAEERARINSARKVEAEDRVGPVRIRS